MVNHDFLLKVWQIEGLHRLISLLRWKKGMSCVSFWQVPEFLSVEFCL